MDLEVKSRRPDKDITSQKIITDETDVFGSRVYLSDLFYYEVWPIMFDQEYNSLSQEKHTQLS